MPLPNIQQPEFIVKNDALRLRKYDGNYLLAVSWYKDKLVRRFSEGLSDESINLDENYVSKKLNWLDAVGEEYFIEIMKNGQFIPIGNVTLKENNPPYPALCRGVKFWRA